MSKTYYIYIITNEYNTVLYTGVTNDIERRVWEYKTKRNPDSFSARYNVDKLVYFEEFDSIIEAIAREKQIKGGSRRKKEMLIYSENPSWEDLSGGWFD